MAPLTGKKAILLALLLLSLATASLLGLLRSAAGGKDMDVSRVEFRFLRPDWNEVFVLDDVAYLQELARQLELPAEGGPAPSLADPIDYHEARSTWANGETKSLWISTDGRLHDPADNLSFLQPKLSRLLLQGVEGLRSGFFGEEKEWDAVNGLFPYNNTAKLIDLRSREELLIVRHGGYRHADVEPFSIQDTEKLKSIYGGKWSWTRRPAVLVIGDHKIAGSMNGMPHGRGHIDDNGFPGHFCLHFPGSRTHGSGKVDPGHYLMSKQAAGLLPELLRERDPAALATHLIASITEKDLYTVLEIIPAGQSELAAVMARLDSLHIVEIRAGRLEGKAVPVKALLRFRYRERPEEFRKRVTINLTWSAPRERWLADDGFLSSLLEEEPEAGLCPPD